MNDRARWKGVVVEIQTLELVEGLLSPEPGLPPDQQSPVLTALKLPQMQSDNTRAAFLKTRG
jgi:hypothetical protein